MSSDQHQFDAVVIGAGFSGLRMLHELRDLGLSTRVLEAGSDVGGTWYWNRYPGARTDSESWVYGFLFDEDLFNEWDWSERYPSQAEVQRYLGHVADRFDMRRDIQFGTEVQSAVYGEEANEWTITTARGEVFTCTYLIPATGLLSRAWDPPFEGVDDFRGESYLAARWPDKQVDFTGKRIGIIGTGATAVQIVPIVAQTAAEVVVFQRTPTYVLPARNRALDDTEREATRGDLARIRRNTRRHLWAIADEPVTESGRAASPDQRRRALEWGWEIGGFQFLFSTYPDMLGHPELNEFVCEFIRDKIHSIVKDPDVARALTPMHPMGAKRPPLGHGYYEAFNRGNVRLVDVAADPIQRVVPDGVRTAAGDHELDMIIYATGFDASTGAMRGIDIRGRDGRSIADTWADGARTYLGLGVDGFPNMFVLNGPHTPLANYAVVIEEMAEWIRGAIVHMRVGNYDRMEPHAEAVEKWSSYLNTLINPLFDDENVRVWFLGTNIPGKPRTALHYFRGANDYFSELHKEEDRGYDGFACTPAREGALAR